MIEELRTGFHASVLEPGVVAPGDRCVLEDRDAEPVAVRALSDSMYRQVADADLVARLQQLDSLAPEWKERFAVLHGRRRGDR